MKKIRFTAMLLILTTLPFFVSCSDGHSASSTGDTTDAPIITEATEPECDLSEYVIVRNVDAGKDHITATRNLRQLINEYAGVSLKIKTDEVNAGEAPDNSLTEILIGNTNRDASVSALEKLNSDKNADYIIEIKGNKIVLNGKSEEAVYYAVKEFMRLFVISSDNKSVINAREEVSLTGSLDKGTAVLDNGKCVKTLYTSVIHASTESVKWPTYERILQLQHNGENNGVLFATGQWAGRDYPIYRSDDDGKSWRLITTVSEQLKPSNEYVASWQPHIYELPNQVGEMPEGTLLLAGCTRDNNVEKETLMCIWRSYDLGKTWEEFTVVDSGNGAKDGMYEPFLICDEDGSLVCFYSDETEVSNVGGQRLVFKVSKDGVNWGEKQYCVAPANKALRPGMVTVAKMGEHGYVLCYEMIEELGGPVYVKTSDSLTDWDPLDKGTGVTGTNGEFTGCTPYCTWTPAGGEYGTIIAAGRFSRPDWYIADGDNKRGDGSKLFASFDLGKTWHAFENPLPYDYHLDSSANYAYSLGFFTGTDGSIYYVNNVFPDYRLNKYLYADMKMAKLKIYDVGDIVE